MTSKHKSEDYKKSAVEYYLVDDTSQLEVCIVSNLVNYYFPLILRYRFI